jgi:hypothetical protein
MGKMCSLSRHTTSLLSGIASLECKMVKNANLCAGSLFTGAEFSVKFPCKLCSICWSNHPRAFVGLVWGKLMRNFCIQPLVHFYCKNWRKFDSKKVKLNWFCKPALPRTTSPARHHIGSPYPARTRTPRCRSDHRSEARATATVH